MTLTGARLHEAGESPVLYSFRRCPFAIRARLALRLSDTRVALREVLLRDKPAALLYCSEKGTVPVLQLTEGEVIDESLDIMRWALALNDPEDCLLAARGAPIQREQLALIAHNDHRFKTVLDRYKYADRHPQHPPEVYRQQGEQFLAELDARLGEHAFLMGDTLSLADMAILPFVRQFANVDRAWFDGTPYSSLQDWLEGLLSSALFDSVMKKYPVWCEGDTGELF